MIAYNDQYSFFRSSIFFNLYAISLRISSDKRIKVKKKKKKEFARRIEKRKFSLPIISRLNNKNEFFHRAAAIHDKNV